MGLVISSKEVTKGDTFICYPKGERYISEALSNGATCVLRLTRYEAGHYACQYYNNPSQSLSVIGVTGTNGKTTVTWFVHNAINQLGGKSALQGTLNSRLTTPEAPETHHNMARHLKQGGTHFVMEVSSHAIDQGRLSGITFDVKYLTNITHDHLDYHGSFQRYHDIKMSFVGNTENNSSISVPPSPHIKGAFNRDNLKATKKILLSLGYKEKEIDPILVTLSPPPGRFEQLHDAPLIIIDYAHTPDALHRVLVESRQLISQTGKLYVIIGCGGDRDRQKRAKMGQISSESADYAIFTQDNPRSEDPNAIITEMIAGVASKNRNHVRSINDRAEAIEHVIKKLTPHDGVVIAGKGHEDVQYIGSKKIPFSDQKVASQFIETYLK